MTELQNRIKGPQKEWVDENFAKLMKKDFKDILKKEIFRPEGPKKQFQWMRE